MTQARSRVEHGGLLDPKPQAQMTLAIGRMMALRETCPALRANENCQMLQNELASTENEIAITRQTCNEACAVCNTGRSLVPTVSVASTFVFNKVEFLDADEGALQSLLAAPRIAFRSGCSGARTVNAA